MDNDRRRRVERGRYRRVTAGGFGAALAIVIVQILAHTVFKGTTMDYSLVIAIATLTGSVVTVVTICAHDIRDIVLAIVMQRRKTDRKQRPPKDG